MQTIEHSQLKSQISAACLRAFPEARAVILWGGAATADFHPEVADVDIIIEIDSDYKQEFILADRLKDFVKSVSFCRLDPFIYLSEVKATDPLEFIAPFGFYKANPFIPHLIQNQHEVLSGESRLLLRLPTISLSEALLAYLPQVLSSVRRLRMDAEIESSIVPIIGKHRGPLFVMIRTLYAFNKGKIGSKKEALMDFGETYPKYRPIVHELLGYLGEKRGPSNDELTPELLLAFAQDMVEALQLAHRRETAH